MSLSKSLLVGLTSNDFRHPLDREATQALRQLPGLDMAVRSVLGPVAERFFYLDNIASSILVSEKQLPDLYKLHLEACKILDLEPPQLYVRQNPVPNAYTFAMRGKQPFIVLHTSLIDMLTPEEIQAVIAHELGHLKCEHSVYMTLVNVLVLAAGQVPSWGAVLAQSLQTQLMEWVRCAEFTCDRAALLVAQDPRVVASVLMKLTGGSPTLASQLNLDAFLEQARSYETMTTDDVGKMLRQVQTTPRSHPLPVLRAREVDRWSSSQEYAEIFQKRAAYDSNAERSMRYNDETENKTSNPGGWRNW